MVVDDGWVNSNPYTAPDAAVWNGDPGWQQVDCPCNMDTFTEFKSITGSGLIGTYETTINNTPYIAITGHPCILTGCNYSPIKIDLCSGGETITIEFLGRRIS